jgi:hypothetical protein
MSVLNKTQLRQAYRIRKKLELEYKDSYLITKDLCGACFIASFEFADYLWSRGVKVKLVMNEFHCFLIKDGYIIDITATQFGCKNKVLIQKHYKTDSKCWSTDIGFTKVSKRLIREATSWPKYQIPKKLKENS